MSKRTTEELIRLLKQGGDKRAKRRALGIPEPDEDEILIARLERENKILRDIIKEFLFWEDDAIDGALSPEIE